MRAWVALIALFSSVAASRAFAADPRALELVERAAKAREAGRLEESLGLMREAYALDPQPKLLNNVGAILEQLGHYDEACATFEQVLATPGIPRELRALDEERLLRLRPKLKSAHVYLIAPKSNALDFGDGQKIEGGVEVALPARAGRTLAVVFDAEKRVASFHVVELIEGRRTTIEEPSTHVDRGTLHVDPPNARALKVDSKSWSFPGGVARVNIDEGFYEIEAKWDEGTPAVWRGSVRRGVRTVVARYKPETPPPPNITVAPQIEEPPARVWPWAAIGGGALAATGAVLLFVSATADVAAVHDHVVNGEVIGVDRARAQELDASAATKGRWAVGLSITGAIALGAGVGGLLLD